MITAKFKGCRVANVYGLTQYDFGRELTVEADCTIIDGAEAQFYQGDISALRYLKDGRVMIPDKMLQQSSTITVYIYVQTGSEGQTVLTAYINVTAREKPSDYIIPDTEEYRRLIPSGGNPGQVLRKLSENEYDTAWGNAADGIKLVDGAIQLMSGEKEIGERVRIEGIDGREVELKNDGTSIAWRYTDGNEWFVLVALSDLTGPPGETPEFKIKDGHLYAIYKE